MTKGEKTKGMFDDQLAAAGDVVAKEKPMARTAAQKKRAAREAAAAAEPRSGFPDVATLDPRIYGLRGRPASGEDLCYLEGSMTDAEFDFWKLRNLPLVWHYTMYHFTEKGKIELLRRRQYSDTEIARLYPDLAAFLDD